MTRTRTRLSRAGLLLFAAAGAWCEASAESRAIERLEARGAGFSRWDVDAHGLHVADAHASARGRRATMDAVHVSASSSGIRVHVDGLAIGEPLAEGADTVSDAEPPASGTDRFRVANRGLPITVTTTGSIAWPLGRGLVAHAVDPRIEIDRDGWPTVHATARLEGVGDDDIVVDDAIATHHAGRWHVAGSLQMPGGVALAVVGDIDPAQQTLTIRDDAGAEIVATREIGEPTVRIEATDFPLRHVGPLLADAAKVRAVSLADATIAGAIEATIGDAMRVHADGVVASGIVLEDARLSARPVELGAVSLDGDAVMQDGRVELQLVVGHGEARIAVGGHADRSRAALDLDLAEMPCLAALDLDLAEMPCDALLGAMPRGTADALVGMRLGGTIAASAHLAFSYADLDRARRREQSPAADAVLARTHRTSADDVEPVDDNPGELAFDFPFLERCTTIADPANVDLAALRGPYRHRFVGDDGKLRERVLAPGSPEFAPLGRVPKLATAFIGLEDMRYWYHDGFDREQIERAFWHNVVNGRVRRGASTISQQTARNLWLGVDRSIARKLQEAYLTTRLETVVSKTRILELYVNIVELGPDIYGVDAAARFYFGIPATELDAMQAIHIAMLAPAPRTYAEKWKSGKVDDAWMAEVRGHAKRLFRNHMIKRADYLAALRNDLRLLDRTAG